MRIAFWVIQAAGTHSEYVMLTAFSRQQGLHERASMLRYVYISCLGHCYLLVCGRTNVRLQRLAARLELVRYCDVVSEQTVTRHLLAHYSSQNGPSVKPDTHLSTHHIDI
jgi:hypothetical protein